MRVDLRWRVEDGPAGAQRLAAALWHPGPGWTMISSGVLGGGFGPREWVLNAQVPGRYQRTDPAAHLKEIAAEFGLTGAGVGLLTAAQVAGAVSAARDGVEVTATVGLRVPTWAATPADFADPELAPIWSPGTVNIIVRVPVPLTAAAYVNAVMTATEAKSQAIIEAGFPGTGTASDAICVAAPADGQVTSQDFTGPRSVWGARIARAVHAAVSDGAASYRERLENLHEKNR